LDNNNGDGLRIAAGYSSFTSAGNTFSNSNYGVRLGINAFFDDNTSSFQGNTIDLYADGGTINQAVIWNLKGDYSVYMAWDITIAASGKLTVKPGTVVKVAQNQGIWVDGQLDARGTSGAPIYFTDWRDDTVGGDANKDGASSAPGPGWWRYLNIRNAGSATLAWCRIAYGGWNDRVGVLKTGSGDLSLYSTIIRNVSGDGLRLDGSSGDHDILKCRFNENSNGVLVRNQTATLAITRSAVEGNAGHGLINQGSFDVDARSCWWGHVSGPYHPASNPEGQGNPVSNGVLFEPWRLTEADNEILTPIRSGTLVKGDSLRFVGAGEAGPAAQYRWHFGGGRTSSLLSPGLVTFPEAGDFTVTYEQVVTGQTDPYPDFRTYSVVDNNTTFPDLEVAAVTVPASLGVGQTATIAYRVKNTGTKALQGAGWIDALYLSTDKYLDIKDTLLARVSVTQDLGIGNVYDGTISFTFPAVEEGAYYLILSINDDWQVIELRRMNNEHAAAANGLVPALISGESQNVAFSDRSLTHYYRIDIAASENLMIPFSSKAAGFEVYVRFGALPSRGTYDYRMDMGTGHLLIPAASVGTWYVLVYGEGLSQADQYSIMYSTADLSLGSVSPGRQGTGLKIDLALTGAGFAAPMQAALEKTGGGGTYHASSVEVDSYTGAVATFAAGSVPAGVYDVKVSRSGGVSAVLPAAVEIVDGGKPRFETRLILPERFGYHQLATVFVEYANRGDAPMPAPLLLLRPTQTGKPGAILTLDKTRLSSGFWTSAMPEGFSNEVQFLASGETPGLLLPGESRRVPIYYAGWQQPWSFSYPPFEWGLGVLSADNATPVDWASMRDAMRPPQMTAEAWTVLWSNFTAQIGPTWGDYVRMLSANAVYLHRLGQRVEAIDKLLGFSLVRADSLNPVHVLSAATDAAVSAPGLSITFERMFAQPISRRYEVGPLGRGWTHAWQFSTAKKADGTIVLTDMTGARRIFQPDSRYSGRYVAQPGDQGSLSDAGGGLMLKEIDGMILTFHGDGRLQYLEDAGGNRITCEYTGTLLTRLNHSSGQWLALTYNASGRIASVMDKDGRGTLYTYGASGAHLLTATSDDGVVTTYAYSSGQGTAREHALTQITLSDGLKQYLTYDGQGRLASLYRDGDAEKITFTYDGHGTVGVQDALGKINRFFFDDMGRLARAENGSGSAVSLEYNDWGLLKKVVDPAGVSRINEFDGKGNLAVLTDAQRNRTRFSYSRAFNRLSRVTDAKGHVSAYDYDARGHLAAITYPDGSRETWTNDGLGNPTIWTNRRGGSIGYTFDGSGRVMRKSYADGPTIDYTYDNRGNLTRTVDGSGTTDFIYDAKDRLTQVDYPGGRRLGFTYDTLGRRATSLDHLGNQIHYHYDAIGRLERLTGNGGADRVRYTYDQAGRLSRKTLGNGVYTDYDYDGAGRLLRLLNQKGDGSVLSSFQYTYDSRGRRTAMDTHYGTWIYRYDGNGQLTKAVLASSDARIPNQDISYEYDALGNRTQALVNGTPIFYSANSLNQYSAVGDKTFAYDADGNLVMDISSGETTTYGYDQENRLVSVARGGKTWTYTYDALGNRASMAEDGVVTSYLIDPAGLGDVVGEYNAAGGLIAGYVHGIGLAGCVGSGGTVDYYTFDAMGNVSELTGADGIRRNAYAYTPFGATILAEKSVANPFAYAGQVGIMADPNGLNHMRARHYAADAGRFIQPDPLGLLGGPNLYSYADNNPVSFLDPQGMAPVPVEALVTWIIKNGSEVAFLNRALRFASIQKIAPHLLSMVHKNQVPQMVSLIIRNLNRGELAGCLKGLVTSSAPAAGTGTAAAGGTAAASSILFTPVSQVGAVPLVAAGAAAFAGGYAIGWAADTYFPNNPASQGAYWLGSAFFNWYYGVSSTASSGTAGSQDPNQKLVAGTGSANAMAYVAGEALLSYRIDFENDAQATAPAQVVLIKDKLSDKLDWSSFELAEVGFGAELIAIPAGLKYFETAVPYRYKDDQYDMEIEVRIEAGLNIERGELFANFYSYDPETGLPPPVNIGFLPPENETGRGQGHVSFIIKPRAGLVSGTEVRNVAAIQFDFGTTIATNQVDPHDPGKGTDPAKEAPATIDLVAPSSSVTAVVPVNDNDLLVSWSGTDVGSGIASYTIYVQENDGPFTPWLTSAATSAVFTGVAGNTYHFYSVATDHVGNKESTTEELYALIVTRIGAGSGVIASSPAGIDCGTDCSETYPPNAVVTLAATADAGSSFRGWAGACTGTGPCRIVMDSPKRKNVTAQFRSLSSRGDLNNDARVDLTDLIVGLKALGRVPSGGLRADLWQADVNANDVVDMGEILYILQAVSEARP
jgi:RHS repeat-associated protein